MRLFFVSLAICLSVFISTAHAQGSSSGDRPLVSDRSPFVLAYIDERFVKEFNGAWQQCVMGTKPTEAVVLVIRQPDGSINVVSAGHSTQAYQFTFKWNPAIIAVFHTHPNNRPPQPVEQDILVARKFGVPIFTLSSRGMFRYDPATDRITKVKSGIDWLDSSSWKSTHLAVEELPGR